MEVLPKSFADRDALIAHVKSLWLDAGGDVGMTEDQLLSHPSNSREA